MKGEVFGVIALAVACQAVGAPVARAATVETRVDVSLHKQFRATGVGNTCEGRGVLSAVKAGTVLYFGSPLGSGDLIARSTGNASIQSSDLSAGVCKMTYLGSAPQGMKNFDFLFVDSFGNRSVGYTAINGVATNQPYSDPAQPSISQIVTIDLLSQAPQYD